MSAPGPMSAKHNVVGLTSHLADAANASFTRRRNTITRRCLLQPTSLNSPSLACQPWPAFVHAFAPTDA